VYFLSNCLRPDIDYQDEFDRLLYANDDESAPTNLLLSPLLSQFIHPKTALPLLQQLPPATVTQCWKILGSLSMTSLIGFYFGSTWFFFGSSHPCEILIVRQRQHYIGLAEKRDRKTWSLGEKSPARPCSIKTTSAW
jgi:hypothetical protein